MGSDSDWPKIHGVADALDEFNVGYEIHVMSAHRTPDKVLEYASSARSRGLGVIIAAAGGAAHLAGVVASHTTLPVVGIPVKTDVMGGLDSLLSTVQMPGDVPVATVGVGSGVRNADAFFCGNKRRVVRRKSDDVLDFGFATVRVRALKVDFIYDG